MPENGPPEVRKFTPKGKGLHKFKLEIFDTWGIKIWENEELEEGSPKVGWDGTRDGVLQPQDVYVWKITAEFEDGMQWQGVKRDSDGIYRVAGSVTLIK